MPTDRAMYYNLIDMGIFLLFPELCLTQEKLAFVRALLPDSGDEEITPLPTMSFHKCARDGRVTVTLPFRAFFSALQAYNISINDRLADYVTLDGARFCAERVLAPRIYEGGGTSPQTGTGGSPSPTYLSKKDADTRYIRQIQKDNAVYALLPEICTPPATSLRTGGTPLTSAGGKASNHPHTIWGKCAKRSLNLRFLNATELLL